MRVLIAPDKFKGSLSAAQAARAMEAGLREGLPDVELTIERLPIADGGEGTAEAVCDALGGRWVNLTVPDPIGRPVAARYALVETDGERLAVFEMSSASGFSLVTGADRDLLRSNTFGTGELLRHALTESRVDRVLLGLGGSATNDGGIGLAVALGYRFLDAAGDELEPMPVHLERLDRIVPPTTDWRALPVTVACDVRNPLLGPRGATRIYGPQKGLRDEAECLRLEAGLQRLADVAAKFSGVDHRETPGAGAAGGLGFGLLSFCGAQLRPGFDLIAEVLRLEAAVARADFIITGEGSLDAQTLEGKAPAGVAALARRLGKPVVAFAGRLAPEARLAGAFDALSGLAPGPMTIQEAFADAGALLQESVARAAGWVQVGARLGSRGWLPGSLEHHGPLGRAPVPTQMPAAHVQPEQNERAKE